ncbi:hypothetical protein O6H91_18G016100 [Diphasiastrum complanatum]|uniref:Uncharacterized protein n=1 Tax=Diphasiastrum complanatum TaxID=34168 RepID=A0ACC2AZB1_DIPCM|nr:hypothetical protein O6H91_18G016100 [Diphasiastrum complanatum]
MPAPASKLASLSRKRRRKQQKTASTLPLLPPEIGEDELEVSEEDVEFVKKHRKYAGFISNLDTNGITRHVMGIKPEWEGEGLEKFYERKGKKFFSSKEDENSGLLVVDPADALPIKTLEGQLHYRSTAAKEKDTADRTMGNGAARVVPTTIVRSREVDQVNDVGRSLDEIGVETRKHLKDVKKQDKEKHGKKRSVGLASSQDLQELDVYISKEERRVNIKSHIAELGTLLLENPEENLPALKELMDMCSDSDERISQLAMLSLMAIFKDLVPGYRIRLPTAKELETQVSKEVQKLRDYESSLLRSYQRYVQMLIKSRKSHSRQKASLRCMCGLLEAIPHFNYRENLLAAVIRQMNSSDAACRIMSRDSIQSLFKNEGKHGGEATVEAVQMIADFVKLNNCLLHPAVLEVFICLSFDDDLARSTDTGSVVSTGRKDNKRLDPKVVSKHQGKRDKKARKQVLANELKKEVESDFKEALAQPDVIERKKLQTMALSAVFETYFRVLKSTESSCVDRIKDLKAATPLTKANDLGDHPLLGVSLEGLTKFTQLISVEYLGDLLRLLCKLVGGSDSVTQQECQSNLNLEERLHCCIVAFKIVRNNLGALNVDLREFYVHFYNLLLEYKPLSDHKSDLLLAQALQAILLEGRQHDMQRVAAFVKRLAGLCLSLGSAAAMSVLVAVQQLLQRNKQCCNMLENDRGGGAVGGTIALYQPFAVDPDLSGALSSILWELNLLGKHYHPAVAKLAAQISSMASSEFVPATMTSLDAVASYSTEEGGFRPAVQPPRKISKRRSYKSSNSSSLVAASEVVQVQGDSQIAFASHFRLLKEFRDNELLRKELTRAQSKLELYKEYKHGKNISRLIKRKKNTRKADLRTSK